MATYKIFPIQDTTMYSLYQTTNAGSDEILEVGSMNNKSGVVSPSLVLEDLGVDDIRRSLILFDTNEILSAISLSATASNVSSSLRLYLAEAENLTQIYSLEVWPVDNFWSNGTGKFNDSPTNTGGTSWKYRSAQVNGVTWNATAQYLTPGGGSWHINYSASQNFTYTSDKDINVNVTNIVNKWVDGTLGQNYGFLVKLPFTGNLSSGDIFEANPQSYINLKFFSMNTHTIYPPCLEFKWNDSTINTGSLSSSSFNDLVVNQDTYVVVSTNNLGEYENNSVYKFRFKARDQFPTRQFTTSSVYLNWKYLPTSSYYAIQDYKTKEMAVDFDNKSTQLSVDPSGSFFTLFMNGLQPERSYRILIKSILSTGEVVIKDNDLIFKVVR